MKLKKADEAKTLLFKRKHEEIYMSDHIVTDILYITCKCQETTK